MPFARSGWRIEEKYAGYDNDVQRYDFALIYVSEYEKWNNEAEKITKIVWRPWELSYCEKSFKIWFENFFVDDPLFDKTKNSMIMELIS